MSFGRGTDSVVWRVSLRRHLLTINLFSLTVSLGLAVALLVAGGLRGWRADEEAELRKHARLAGALLGEALRSNDTAALERSLGLLEIVPELVFAEVYDAEGAVLAHYQRADETGGRWGWSALPQAMDPQSPRYYWQFVEMSEPIRVDRQPVGTFYLVADLRKLYSALFRYLGLNTVGAALALLSCFLLLQRLQRSVTAPLNRLVTLVRRVARQRDYGLRAEPPAIAELAELAEGFNDMLGQVQRRDGELRRELEERKLAESRFRYVADHAPVMIWMTDSDQQCTFVNQVWLNFTGLSEAESIGRDWERAIHPEDRKTAFGAYYTAQPAAEPIATEYRLRRHDGSYRWIMDTGMPLFDSGGHFAGYIGSCVDITERKQAEAELQVAATTFQTNEAIVITDAAGTILRVNQAFCAITGYAPDEVIGKNPRLLQSQRHDPEFYRQLWKSVLETGYWKGELWNRRKDGETYPELLSITAVKDKQGAVTHYVGAFSDITQTKKTEAEIRHLAFYDPLTRLPNRRLLLDRLGQAIPAAHRNGNQGALLFIDLDNFKTLNDTLGHSVGDRLLERVAERLAESVRAEDTVARLGGDEFVVLLPNIGKAKDAAAENAKLVAEKIRALLNRTFDLGEFLHYVTPSVGVTLFGEAPVSSDEVLKQADMAMYRAKGAGRNTVRFFESGMEEALTQRLQLETDLRQALLNRELRVFFQPQFDRDRRLIGAEALVRWNRAGHGPVAPAEFIPLAEENGLIIPIGGWVLQCVGTWVREWEARYAMQGLRFAVNVSSRQFRQAGFVDQMRQLLEEAGANPERITLEITESAVLDNLADAHAKMEALKTLGVIFSLDDFGTGYSSLSYLKSLPIAELKIDKSFVQDILNNEHSAVIVRTIIAMSQQLKLETVAEGVEEEAQAELLARCGCRAFQGYWFGRPMPPEEFERWLRRP
jgi:diguanylate cyclase (GGDEF)-like protein/PAS domain S-box-containing protein